MNGRDKQVGLRSRAGRGGGALRVDTQEKGQRGNSLGGRQESRRVHREGKQHPVYVET